jgi:hypothetical protein
MNIESTVAVIALISIVAFFISLGTDMFDGFFMDLLPEKFRKGLRWTLGIIAFVSTVAYIMLSLKN